MSCNRTQNYLETTAEFLEDVIYDNLAVIGSHIRTMKDMDQKYNCGMYEEFRKSKPDLEVLWRDCEKEYDQRLKGI